MATEALIIPEQYLSITCDILQAGLHVLKNSVPDDVREPLQEWIDEARSYTEGE